MAEAAARAGERMEFEVRGGPWEGIHAFIFYTSVTFAVLATIGIMRLPLGISCVVLLFYSMFAIFSSPTYVSVDPAARELTLERYRYFISSRRRLGRDDLEEVEVAESPRVPTAEGGQTSRRDLSYFVRVCLKRKNGRPMKLFRSGTTGAPAENRAKAFLIVESVARAMDIPVVYTRRGLGDGSAKQEWEGE